MKKEAGQAERPPALLVEQFTKRYGDFTAVSGLCLQVAAGEIYAFLGPNGAGKTTTLRAAAGLLRLDEGRISVAGRGVKPDAIPFREALGFVPDRPYLYEKLTGWEHLEFVAGARRLKGWRDTARHYLQLFGLEGWEGKLIEGYSHGMRQKLSLASALLHGPALLLVDEPMVGLDPRSARTAKELFRSLAEGGTGILLSTHSLDAAQDLAHRIGILNRGRLVAEGSLQQIREQAERPGSDLEEVFLRLTEDEEEGGL